MKCKKRSVVLAAYEGCMGKLIYTILYQKRLTESTLSRRRSMRSQRNRIKTCIFNSPIVLSEVVKEVNIMTKNSKQTSRRVASTASKILRDGRYGKASKSVAGSALAQTKPSGKK